MSRVVLGKPSLYIYGHPFSESLPVTAHYLPFCEKKKPFQEQEKPIRKRIVLTNSISHTRTESSLLSYPLLSVVSLSGKRADMKLVYDNIRVLYIATDCVEPYVEVGLSYSLTACLTSIVYLSLPAQLVT